MKKENRKKLPKEIKDKLYIKYNKSCDICGNKKKLEIHHKDHNKLNNSLDNLTLLCEECHTDHHSVKFAFEKDENGEPLIAKYYERALKTLGV